jgi:hypothetical protein
LRLTGRRFKRQAGFICRLCALGGFVGGRFIETKRDKTFFVFAFPKSHVMDAIPYES